MAVYLGADEVNFRGGRPSEVTSVNGETGDVVLDIPEKTSDLVNDSGFIADYTETDPTVPAWAKAPSKPTYTASEVGALPSSTVIPSKTSDLTNDSGYITGYTETDPTVPSWAKASSKPSYTFSEIGSTPSSLSGYGITDAYTKTQVDGLVSGVLHYKGTKTSVSALPSSGNTTGDVWHITADGSEWAWDGTQWQELGTAVDLSGYVPTSRTVNGKALSGDISLTASDVSALPNNTSIPTKTSDLTNDSGFITSYTETDPTVPSWAKASTKPTYTADEVGAIRGNVGGVFYGTCATVAGTVAKVVDCADFTADNLKAGTIIVVTFTATNSGAVASLTMNVNSTGAKPIKYINNGTLGNLTSAGYIKAGTEYPFYYDGANWVCWFNVNTTYSALSEADMHTGTATTARLITAQRLKQAVQYHAPVTSVNGSTGDVTISVPTKTSELTNDSGFLTSAPVTSVNGQTGAVTINVPTAMSELTNDSGYITSSELEDAFANAHMFATDATSQAVLSQAFGISVIIRVPSDITTMLVLLYHLEPRIWFCWMNGAELEFARLSVSVNVSNNAITLYLRGRTSIATGIMGADSSWTVTPIPSVPTAVSELTNDSGYLTLADLPIYNGGVQ